MSGDSGYTHFDIPTSYGIGKAGENARQACVFSPTSEDRLNEPHGKARAPFPVKRRKRETDKSVSNDEIQNRAMTTELYCVGLGKHILSGAFSNCEKQLTALWYMSVCLSVHPYVSMEQLGSQLTDFQHDFI